MSRDIGVGIGVCGREHYARHRVGGVQDGDERTYRDHRGEGASETLLTP